MTDKGMRGVGEVRWVSTAWLQSHWEDEDLTIVDCQPDIHDYIKAHIARAVYVPEKTRRAFWRGMPGVWIAPGAAASIFGRAGLRQGAPVLVYTGTGLVKGWGDGLEQTMLAYSLLRFGHDCVYLLDGGLSQWLAEGRPVTQAFPAPAETRFKAAVQADVFIGYDEFKRRKDDDDVIVLDARPANVYSGEGPWIRNGHVPGAVNLPWRSLMDAGNPALLKPIAEIEALIAAAGASQDKWVICTCGTGREATNEYLLFKHRLGFPKVRLYEGSFTEWSQYPENPVVTGPKPR